MIDAHIVAAVEFAPGKKIAFGLYRRTSEDADKETAVSVKMKADAGAEILLLVCVNDQRRFWLLTLGLINSTIDVAKMPALLAAAEKNGAIPDFCLADYLWMFAEAYRTGWPALAIKN